MIYAISGFFGALVACAFASILPDTPERRGDAWKLVILCVISALITAGIVDFLT